MEFSPKGPRFKSPEEELAYLRQLVAEKEHQLHETGLPVEREVVISSELKVFAKQNPEEVLSNERQLSREEQQGIVLDLAPRETDAQIGELLGILEEKGLLNTLKIVEASSNPELEDDFHRFLVQYLAKGYSVGLKERDPIFRALRMTLYQVALPEVPEKEQARAFKELVSSMEQFYAGMLSVGEAEDNTTLAFEVAVPNDTQDIRFYAAVPNSKKDLFEKQFLSVFPDARIEKQLDDYNIFSDNSAVSLSYASFAKNPIFPLRLYDTFDYDPLNIVLNAFSKIARDGEGASLQFILSPEDRSYNGKYQSALNSISKGTKVKDAIRIADTALGEVGYEFLNFFKEASKGTKDDKQEPSSSEKDRMAVENIKRKIAAPVIRATLRAVIAAPAKDRSTSVLRELQSAFNQFEDAQSNSLVWQEISDKELPEHIRQFSFRMPNDKFQAPFSLKELTTLFHFPSTGRIATFEVEQSRMATAPAPHTFDEKGLMLGLNQHRGQEVRVTMAPEDRLRHFYCIGQTGTGKSTLLKNMVIQDIQRGEGVCMIDPHGNDIIDILANVPQSRYEDVIYFDPSYTPRPLGLNMLEYDIRFPEQKTFVVDELLAIFNRLFDMKVAGGPAFEQYFRNSALLVMDHPQSGNTLLEIARVLADSEFRKLKLSHCKNPTIVQFWENAERTTGEQALANFVPYVTNKFDVFLTNEIMRPIVAQERSAFNFREIMDSRKILLVNLSKGRLGEINANLIGLILVGKLLMAALSRADSIGKDFPPFYLYIDEFQNVTTDSIATIFSEARKYKLSLNVAHQYIKQLDEKIKNAVFGNVGNIATFRIDAEDAEYLEKTMSPVFTAKDITNIENWNAYVRMLVHGRPERPFSIKIPPPSKGSAEVVGPLRELSYIKYGRDRNEVEEEIKKRFSRS